MILWKSVQIWVDDQKFKWQMVKVSFSQTDPVNHHELAPVKWKSFHESVA